eukprot:2140865-Amphidinium_carterae.1
MDGENPDTPPKEFLDALKGLLEAKSVREPLKHLAQTASMLTSHEARIMTYHGWVVGSLTRRFLGACGGAMSSHCIRYPAVLLAELCCIQQARCSSRAHVWPNVWKCN